MRNQKPRINYELKDVVNDTFHLFFILYSNFG